MIPGVGLGTASVCPRLAVFTWLDKAGQAAFDDDDAFAAIIAASTPAPVKVVIGLGPSSRRSASRVGA